MTVFPGSELDQKLHAAGRASDFDVEGLNTRVFYQHRVNLKYPRPVEDTFWIALTQMLSKEFVPRGALKRLAESETLKRHPWPLIQAANAANVVEMNNARRQSGRGEVSLLLRVIAVLIQPAI